MISFKVTGEERAKNMFQLLAQRVGDLRPIWKTFIPYYRETIIRGAFNTKGKIMKNSWKPYKESYLKYLRRNRLDTEVSLRRSDTMYNAAIGGAGWKDKQEKQQLTMGIEGEKYFGAQQEGYPANNLVARSFFYTDDDDLPLRAWAYLVKSLDDYYKKVDK
jgi:hypothetical protein